MNKKQAAAPPPAPQMEAAQPVEMALEPAEKPEVTADQIAELIGSASEEIKSKIRSKLDLDKTHARVRKNTANNQQVRNTVKAFGEVTHAPDFIPAPPSRIAQRGPEAVAIWKNRWLEGNGNNLSEFDLDQISEAHM